MTQILETNWAIHEDLDLEVDCATGIDLPTLPRLGRLSLSFVGSREVPIAGKLDWIGNAPRLQALRVRNLGCIVHSEQIVAAVTRCQRLNELTVGQLVLPRRLLEQLASLQGLESLTFQNCLIDEAAVGELFPYARIA